MNRADVFGETLHTIAREIDETAEVVILDGSADEATESVVERFRGRLPALSYERRPPEGIDRDYARVVGHAQGEYCWLFSDDDWLLPGACAAVKRALEIRPDCVIVNFEQRDASMHEVVFANYLGFEDDRCYGPGEYTAFARDAFRAANYIGSLVVRRSFWMARDAAAYVGTEFAHVGRLFQAPSPGRTAVLGRPVIATRLGVSGWNPRGFRIWMIDWPAIVWNLPGLDDATREKATSREPWRSLKRLVRLRATGGFGRKDYERWMKPARLGFSLRICAWLLCRAPTTLVNAAAWAFVRMFRPHLRLYRAELEGAMIVRRARRRASP